MGQIGNRPTNSKFEPKPFREIMLKRIKFSLSERVSHYVLERIRVETEEDFFTREVIFRIEMFLAGQQKIETRRIDIFVPSTWWQHFKQDNFPKWLLKYFPVKEKIKSKEVTFNHQVIFPTMNLPKGHPPIYHTYTYNEPEL